MAVNAVDEYGNAIANLNGYRFGERTDDEIYADGAAGRPLRPGEQNRWESISRARTAAAQEAARQQELSGINSQIDQNFQGAQGYLNQLPTYQDVQFQGPNAQDIQNEFDYQNRNLEAATNPYAYGTTGNLAINELARQQGNATRRGLLGASGSINQGAALAQQGNIQQAGVLNALSNERFVRRSSLGTALTGLAQYNQGNRYNSQLQKALQGLSTYGDYYAKPKLAIGQTRLSLGEKNRDYQNQFTDQNYLADKSIRAASDAAQKQSDNGFLGTAIGIGSKLFGL
jgi:hypothetical protein